MSSYDKSAEAARILLLLLLLLTLLLDRLLLLLELLPLLLPPVLLIELGGGGERDTRVVLPHTTCASVPCTVTAASTRAVSSHTDGLLLHVPWWLSMLAQACASCCAAASASCVLFGLQRYNMKYTLVLRALSPLYPGLAAKSELYGYIQLRVV